MTQEQYLKLFLGIKYSEIEWTDQNRGLAVDKKLTQYAQTEQKGLRALPKNIFVLYVLSPECAYLGRICVNYNKKKVLFECRKEEEMIRWIDASKYELMAKKVM